MRIFVAVLVAAGVMSAASPARAGTLLETIFPFLAPEDTGPRPEETLEAPFADPQEAKAQQQTDPHIPAYVPPKAVQESNVNRYDQPHRSIGYVSEWVSKAVSESLSMDSKSYEKKISSSKAFFDPIGLQEYETFLTQNRLREILDKGDLRMTAFVQDVPYLRNQGTAGGYYKWLYEVRVMTTFLDRKAREYKSSDQAVNRNYILLVEVTRALDSKNSDGLAIDRWTARGGN